MAVESPLLVLVGGHLFDVALGRMRRIAGVVIEGERIRDVLPEGTTFVPPRDACLLDVRDRFIIPGLIDAHVHLVHVLRSAHMTADELFPLFLACGVTTVRDVGDEVVAERLLQRYADRHPEACPRVSLCSPLVDGDPPYHSHVSWPVRQASEIPGFVSDMAGWGVKTFKIYVGVDREIGRALIAEAHSRGCRVTAHLGKYRAQDAVADGIDCLEHIASVFDYILPPDVPEWPPLHERRRLPAAEVAALERRIMEAKAKVDLDHPRVTALVEALVKHDVAVDPTLVVFHNWMLFRDVLEVRNHPDVQRMPGRLREYWLESAENAPPTPDTLELRRAHWSRLCELTGRLHRAGVRLLAGTDSPVQFCPPGFALHQELELLVAAGLSPAAALTAATRHNAQMIQREDDLGTIEPGKLADLAVLDADPLEDIRNTRRIHRVMRSGVVCEPARLLEQVPVR